MAHLPTRYSEEPLRFRELALKQIESQKHLGFMKRYFDPRVFSVIERNPELLNLRSDTVSICFWDVRGFSKLCESLKAHPTMIAGFLREYFDIAAAII